MAGETVKYRPKGQSMKPRIKSGELVTVSPDVDAIEKGDVVFCKVNGYYYVHLVTAIKGKQYQISNNHGHVNGWVTKNGIFGKVTAIES